MAGTSIDSFKKFGKIPVDLIYRTSALGSFFIELAAFTRISRTKENKI